MTDELGSSGVEPFDLRLVAPFVALAEELHLGRAAMRSGVGQPTFARQIRQLERQLGVALVERPGRRIELTAAGARFLAGCREILERAADAEHEAGGTAALRVHLGHASNPVVRGLYSSFVAANPDVDVHEAQGTGSESMRALADGSADVGFDLPTGAPPGTASLVLDRSPLGVVCAVGDRLARGGPASWADLRDRQILTAPSGIADAWSALVARVLRAEDVPVGWHVGPRVNQSTYLAPQLLAGTLLLLIARWEFDPPPPGLSWVELFPHHHQEIAMIWDDRNPGEPLRRLVDHARAMV